MERASKILNALIFAYLGAWGVLLSLHVMLNPRVPEVELLLSWAWWGWMLMLLAQAFLQMAQGFLQPKAEDGWRPGSSPALIGALVIIFLLIGGMVAFDSGMRPPWGLDTPLMAVPLCLLVALIAARFASRNADRTSV